MVIIDQKGRDYFALYKGKFRFLTSSILYIYIFLNLKLKTFRLRLEAVLEPGILIRFVSDVDD